MIECSSDSIYSISEEKCNVFHHLWVASFMHERVFPPSVPFERPQESTGVS